MTSQTKPSTPRLSEVARKVVVPSGVVSTGWPAVEAKCRDLGISFRWWQQPIGRLILSKRADGKYAGTIGGTGLSIPRQVGKTFLVGAIVFALCLLRPGLTVIWTAHRLRTAEETFGKMQAFAQRKKIAPHVAKIVLGSGEEEIRFKNGSRILFGARERGFGRGFDEVDVLVCDEAQIMTENAMDDIVPATNQSRQPEGALLLFMGTPPKPTDPSEVFTRMRSEALSGEDEDTGWVEFGADPGYKPTPLPALLVEADWKQVAKANPSYPQDTPREAILRMRKKLGAESYLREGLGIWDEGQQPADRALDASAWSMLADPGAERGSRVFFGLDVAEDRTACIAVAWERSDGDLQVMLTADEAGRVDAGLAVPVAVRRVNDLLGKWGGTVVVGGSAADLVDKINGPYVVTSAAEFATACGAFMDAVAAATIHHGNQAVLNDAVRDARPRSAGTQGQRAWQLRGAVGIGPLVAATRAAHGALTGSSVYEDRGMVTL